MGIYLLFELMSKKQQKKKVRNANKKLADIS